MGRTPSPGERSADRPASREVAAVDERHRLLVEGIHDYAIVMLDPEGWVTTWNPGAERVTGYVGEEIIGRHWSVLYPQSDDERGRPALELHEAVETGRVEREGWWVRKDGSRFWASVVIAPLRRPDGELRGFATVTRDRSQRRQAEEALRQTEVRLAGIIGSAMDAIISVNEAQEIVVFNAAAERIFGCPAADAIGTSLHRFLPARFRASHERHIRAFGETGVTTRSMGELRPLMALRADGVEFPIEATISQVDVGGQRLFSVILRDVTERKRAEAERERLLHEAERQAVALEESNRELARMAAEAAAANKAKSDFLAMMSHELRTPLNAIAGYAQLLEMGLRGPTTTEQRGDLSRIRRSGQHLLAVINNILNFARLEAGQLEYSFASVPLADAIAEVGTLLEPQIAAKGIAYEAPVCDRALVVRADPDKLRQILLNLLTNAMKFTAPRGCIQVECAGRPELAVIQVRDSGCGIAADKLERIFEPFVQLERSLTNTMQGTGLGLAISRDLARGMGGDLMVESTAGVGSTFTVALPLAAVPPQRPRDGSSGRRPAPHPSHEQAPESGSRP